MSPESLLDLDSVTAGLAASSAALNPGSDLI